MRNKEDLSYSLTKVCCKSFLFSPKFDYKKFLILTHLSKLTAKNYFCQTSLEILFYVFFIYLFTKRTNIRIIRTRTFVRFYKNYEVIIMKSIRRGGLLFFVLFIGILLGTLGIQAALLIVSPLFIIWFMLWDEKQYTQVKRKYDNSRYNYRKYP